MRKRLTEADLQERLEQAEMRAEDLAQEYANLSALRREHEAEIGMLERCLEEVGRLFGLTAGDNELWASDLTRRIAAAVLQADQRSGELAVQVRNLTHRVANLQTTVNGYKYKALQEGAAAWRVNGPSPETAKSAVADATGCGS